jgi:hypothetical protein
MILAKRAPRPSRIALSVACLLVAGLAMSATALAATAIHFEPESLPALEGQLHHGQVHALSFHPSATTGHIHVSLNDGKHMTVAYVNSEQAHVIALANAAGTPVVIAQAKPKAAAKPVHHKLRYIAGGILVLVVIVVLAVLLIDRRRKLGEAGGDGAGDGAAVSSSSAEQP